MIPNIFLTSKVCRNGFREGSGAMFQDRVPGRFWGRFWGCSWAYFFRLGGFYLLAEAEKRKNPGWQHSFSFNCHLSNSRLKKTRGHCLTLQLPLCRRRPRLQRRPPCEIILVSKNSVRRRGEVAATVLDSQIMTTFTEKNWQKVHLQIGCCQRRCL